MLLALTLVLREMRHHHQHLASGMRSIETKNLTACCPSPKAQSMKDDAECKSHIEGIESMDNKQKHKAYTCFVECIFKSKGLIEGKDVKWDKVKEVSVEFHEPEFKEVVEKAVDFCEAKGELRSPLQASK